MSIKKRGEYLKKAASKGYKIWINGALDRYEVSTNDQNYSPDELKKVAEGILGERKLPCSVGTLSIRPATELSVYETKEESVVVNFEWEEAKDALDKATETLEDSEDEVLEQ